MTKPYTCRGDGGETDLPAGHRVRKDDPHVEACGCIDELNCLLGWVAAAPGAASARETSVGPSTEAMAEIREATVKLQADLFELGAEVAASATVPPSQLRITEKHVGRLEREIDRLTALLPPLSHFILPGGSECAARVHLARAVCRRAERAMVSLAARRRINPHVLAYLNRASDLLFALGRRCNQLAGISDVLWPA